MPEDVKRTYKSVWDYKMLKIINSARKVMKQAQYIFALLLAALFGFAGLALIINADKIGNVLMGVFLVALSTWAAFKITRLLKELINEGLTLLECPFCGQTIKLAVDPAEPSEEKCGKCGSIFQTDQVSSS
ncbi:MAG: hypothetical protein GY853_10345 [PVC group bacterium]|nr:hypothetical protein [PVC group bacterium]